MPSSGSRRMAGAIPADQLNQAKRLPLSDDSDVEAVTNGLPPRPGTTPRSTTRWSHEVRGVAPCT